MGRASSPAASATERSTRRPSSADVDPSMRIFREELFGPAVAVTPVANADEALRLANQTSYGLTAGVFTND